MDGKEAKRTGAACEVPTCVEGALGQGRVDDLGEEAHGDALEDVGEGEDEGEADEVRCEGDGMAGERHHAEAADATAEQRDGHEKAVVELHAFQSSGRGSSLGDDVAGAGRLKSSAHGRRCAAASRRRSQVCRGAADAAAQDVGQTQGRTSVVMAATLKLRGSMARDMPAMNSPTVLMSQP